MIAYISIYSALSLASLVISARQAKVCLIVILLFLLWFMGGRYYVGCDFTGYLHRFDTTPALWVSEISLGSEWGLPLLIGSVRALGLDYMWLNVAASIIILFGFYNFLMAFESRLEILTLMFPIIIVQLSMSGIRQGIAVALLMGSASSFIAGRRFSTALWILAASAFHTSAVIFLPIALVARKRVTAVRLLAAALVLLPVSAIIGADRLDTYQSRYIDQIYGEIYSGGAFIRYAMTMFPVLLMVKCRRSFKERFFEEYELLKLFAIIITSIAPLALLSSLALHRISFYVMPFSIVIFVYVCIVLAPRDRLSRLLVRISPLVFYGVYMVGWLVQSYHADVCYIPYDNYLWI